MIYRQMLVCFLLILLPLSAKALPPPSPAGGNYLVLDKVDDHAVLDFETFGRLLPDGAEEFTVEAWIYPTTATSDTAGVILHQQVRMLIVNDEFQPLLNNLAKALNVKPPKGDLILLMNAYLEGNPGTSLPIPISLEPNQWHHIAYQSKGNQITMIANDFVGTLQHGLPLGHNARLPEDLVLGGFGKRIRMPVKEEQFFDSFTGYIDEVRISKVARYDVNKKGFMPDDKFKNDAETVALWHFDEQGGTRGFSDASGNAHHLVGKNGVETGIPLAVEAAGKLATTWGRLKR